MCVAINSALAARSPMAGSIWQHAILTMVQRYGTAGWVSWTDLVAALGDSDGQRGLRRGDRRSRRAGRLLLGRVPRAVRRGCVVQHHLRAIRFGLQPLS